MNVREWAQERIGQSLREKRLIAGFSQRELAARMVVAGHAKWTQHTVSNIEVGRSGGSQRSVTIEEFWSLGDILGFARGNFLAGSGR